MPFSAGELSQLSRLLDEAMDLPSADIEAWLLALPAEHQHLQGQLRQMLSERDSTRSAGFLSDGPQLSGVDESVAHPDDLVGPYRLIREIGSGGMGAVWLAERADGSLKRHIALKLPRLAWGAGLAERMARERDIGALLEHPNIARLYDAGVDARGRPYLALEYIDGQPLDAWCEAQALSIRQRIQLFLQVARAVAYAHGRLVVHRDLKPSNVLVTADGQAHLLDFGIAKLLDEAGSGNLTQEQGRVLTPHYASPEQISGETITVASDVYSLGALLYELLTGQHPYSTERKGLGAIEQAMLEGEPALASSRVRQAPLARQLRGEIDAILAKALRREPSQRYATADALAQDLERHLQGERVLARPDSFAYRVRKVLRRYRVAFATSGVVLLAVLGGAGVSIVQAKRANDEAERARVVKEFVVDVFKINSPGSGDNADLRQLPAEMLLERGGKLIESRFAGQPSLQAELFGVVGGIFSDMGASALAVDYASRQIGALAAIDAAPLEQGQALLLLARALLQEDRAKDAEVRARRAQVLLDSNPILASEAGILVARALDRQNRMAESVDQLTRTQELIRKSGPKATIARAEAEALRAHSAAVQGRLDQALPLYESAITDALEAEGPASSTAIELRLAVAGALIVFDRLPEAVRYRDAALHALRGKGRPGEIRAALQDANLAFQIADSGQMSYAEGKVAIELDRDALRKMGTGVPAVVRAKVDLLLGMTYCFWGDIDQGDRLISQASAVLRPLAETPAAKYNLATRQGYAAMLAGRNADADRFAKERLEMGRQIYASSPFSLAQNYQFATNLTMQGRFDEAELFLASLGKANELRGGNPSSQPFDIYLAFARNRLDRGDPSPAINWKEAESMPDPAVAMSTRLLIGEGQCVGGDPAEGLEILQQAILDFAPTVSTNEPYLARARAVAGLCALAMGRRKVAFGLAEQARHAFLAQPNVNSYFKQPLNRLEHSLLIR